MAARRSKGRGAGDENRSITPDQPGRDSPRSRKCLDLVLKGGVKASPLVEHNRAWQEEEETVTTTPAKRRPLKEDRERLQLSTSSPLPPTSPDVIPKTPTQVKPRFSSSYQAGTPKSGRVQFPTPQRRKRSSLPPIPDQFKQAPPSARKAAAAVQLGEKEKGTPPHVDTIAAASFYSRRSGGESDSDERRGLTVLSSALAASGLKTTAVKSGGDSRSKAAARKSSRPVIDKPTGRNSTGGRKRKRTGGLGVAGVSHAIKRPKKRPCLEPVKISELPTVSIEIPKARPSIMNTEIPPLAAAASPSIAAATPTVRKSAVRTPSTTPRSGNFRVSKDTRVDVEVTGGQIVYRKKSKISSSSKTTPLRRSPRKNLSPLKQSYLAASSNRPARRSGSQKLFSPQGPADFLGPETSGKGSPRKFIPSPVKFRVSAEEEEEEAEENDFSQLINNLGEDEEQKVDGDNGVASAAAYTVYATDEELAQTAAPSQADQVPPELVTSSSSTSAQFFSDADCAQAALQAVNDILGDMETTDDADEMTTVTSTEMTKADDGQEEEPTARLFPIFYKSTAAAVQGDGDSGSSSPAITAPAATRPQTGRRLAVSRDQAQMQIDAGQERGPTLCLTCGAVYSKGDPVDEANHESLHSGVLERLRFPGWRSERVGGVYGEGRVVVVQPGDPPHMWRKVQEALTTVDRDLGFSEVGIRAPEQTKAFLYISQKRIVGLLLAEAIQQGFKMVVSQDAATGAKVPMCSEVGVPVKCGISRIWVLAEYRRKRVASSLVDAMRINFIIGEYLAELDFAFSDPTLNGYDFAASYLRRPDFLVYNR